jgi:hypothetical protein
MKNAAKERAKALAFYRQFLPDPDASIILLDNRLASAIICTIEKDAEPDIDPTHWGCCYCFDDFSFVVAVNYKLPLLVQLKIMAHEMAHVRQYQLGKNMPNTSGLEYSNDPSEIEANGRSSFWFGKLMVEPDNEWMLKTRIMGEYLQC